MSRLGGWRGVAGAAVCPVVLAVLAVLAVLTRPSRVAVLVVVRPVRTWLCGPTVTTSESSKTSIGVVNLKISGLSPSNRNVLVILLNVLTIIHATECIVRFPSLPCVFTMLLTFALIMLMAPEVPVNIGGTLNVSRVGHEISDDVFIVQFMNFVLTLVNRTSSNEATEKFVTTFCTSAVY